MLTTSEKSLAVGSVFCLATYLALMVLTPPARSYEVTVYSAYPSIAWVLLALTLSLSILLILTSARSESATWQVGLTTALFGYAIFSMIPVLRGYQFYGSSRSDAFYHVGAVKDILQTGALFDHLYYPGIHLVMTEVSLITGLSPRVLASLLPFLFFVVLLMGVYFLARTLYDAQAAMYCLAAGIPLVYLKYQITVMPWLNGLTLTCFIFGAALHPRRHTQNRYRILLLFLLVALVFYHPISAITTVGGLLAWRVVKDAAKGTRSVYQSFPEVLTIIIAYSWYFSFQSIQLAATRIVYALLSSSSGTTSYTESAATSGYTLFQLVTKWIIGRWGVPLLFASLGMAACVALVYWRSQKQDQVKFDELLPVVQYGFGLVTGGLLFVSGTIGTNPIRSMKLPILFSILLVGSLLYHVTRRTHIVAQIPARPIAVILVGLLLSASVMGAMTIFNPNRHVTETSVTGITWHIDYQDDSLHTRSQGIDHKLLNYIYGAQWVRSVPYEDRTFSVLSKRKSIPEAIGYQTHTHVSDLYSDRGGYLIVRTQDIKRYQSLPPNKRAVVSGYLPKHRSQLRSDPSANRIYSNGPYQTLFIHGNYTATATTG